MYRFKAWERDVHSVAVASLKVQLSFVYKRIRGEMKCESTRKPLGKGLAVENGFVRQIGVSLRKRCISRAKLHTIVGKTVINTKKVKKWIVSNTSLKRICRTVVWQIVIIAFCNLLYITQLSPIAKYDTSLTERCTDNVHDFESIKVRLRSCGNKIMIAYIMLGNFPELLSLSVVTACVSKYNKHLEESEMYPFTN